VIELSSREHVLSMVEQNPEWNVLDLGCGADGIRRANVYADIEDRSESYRDKRFVQTEGSDTPFKKKEFDFAFALHIAEHVDDPYKFCAELTRIAKRGFIEVPTPFFDNFVFGNSNPPPHGHVWWVTFDNVKKEIVFKPRLQVVAEMATPADTTFLLPFFRGSMVTELYWEDTIELRQDEAIFSWDAGNSDKERIVDLRGKQIPNSIRKWRPRGA
jgi:hypothetical protein